MSATKVVSAADRSRVAFDFRSVGVPSAAVCRALTSVFLMVQVSFFVASQGVLFEAFGVRSDGIREYNFSQFPRMRHLHRPRLPSLWHDGRASDGARPGVEHGHQAAPLDPILPFIGIGMPVHLPKSARAAVAATEPAAVAVKILRLEIMSC